MSVLTFIPQVWNAALLETFKQKSIAGAITFAPKEIIGNKIIYNNVSDIAVKDYEGSVSFDDLGTTDVELNMDQKKYFAFKVDDVDAVQAAGPLKDPHIREASGKVAKTVDDYVLTAIVENTVVAHIDAPAVITKENAYDSLVDLNRSLDSNDVDQSDRFIVIDWTYMGMLEKDDRFTLNYKVLENGIVEGSSINGATLVVTNNLPTTVEKTTFAIALHKSAVGYGMQVDKIESLRLESAFADGVRGLSVFGAGVIRPTGAVYMSVDYTA